MKIIPLLVLSGFVSASALAQNFGGTLHWSMKTDITDPAMQQQMQQAQAQLNDPATQAKMQQMQAAMNDPQMRAMMENNPQMKAMMEHQMGMMAGGPGGGNASHSLMPTGMTLKIKDGRTLFNMEGGPMPMSILTLPEKSASYALNVSNKTYTTLPAPAPDQPAKTDKYKVTKTGESATILGYTCQKFLVEQTDEQTTLVIWATTQIPGVDAKQLARMRTGRGKGSNFMKDIQGVPLKMEIHAPKMNMTMEATAVNKESLSDDLFSIPSDYTESAMGRMMMPGQ